MSVVSSDIGVQETKPMVECSLYNMFVLFNCDGITATEILRQLLVALILHSPSKYQQ